MKKITRENFLNRKRIGVILRGFAKREKDVPSRIEMFESTIRRLQNISIEGHKIFRRIDILIAADKRFSQRDCGKTAGAMREKYKSYKEINISEVRHGDLFCGILNYGVALQSRNRIDYSLILSPEASSYINEENITAMIDAACQGALVAGLALNELTNSILEGRIANTFAMWHNISLLTVGGFDLRASMPVDDRTAHYMRGFHKEKGEVYYHLAGVEEMIPLARLIELFGPCIAPMLPQGDKRQQYQVPDPKTQKDLWERHVSKMGTKLERQSAYLNFIGFDISWIQGGVMDQYCSF